MIETLIQDFVLACLTLPVVFLPLYLLAGLFMATKTSSWDRQPEKHYDFVWRVHAFAQQKSWLKAWFMRTYAVLNSPGQWKYHKPEKEDDTTSTGRKIFKVFLYLYVVAQAVFLFTISAGYYVLGTVLPDDIVTQVLHLLFLVFILHGMMQVVQLLFAIRRIHLSMLAEETQDRSS
ncbi:MAG: hypothetical protein HC915_01565 [Anaerolineae bacterium]|nr:hypothetical protein [Anaerolineae bacterium]